MPERLQVVGRPRVVLRQRPGAVVGLMGSWGHGVMDGVVEFCVVVLLDGGGGGGGDPKSIKFWG